MEFWQLLGNLHPKLVQFPLVLLLVGLLFDAAGLISHSPRCHFAAKILSSLGTFILLVAFICGIYAEIWAGRAGIPIDQIEWHELMANIASWGFVILMAWRLFLDGPNRKSLILYTVVGFAWYVLLVITGYLGGRLVFDYGAAVIGARANNAISLHDLNALATRQTDENLRYSEMMHHIFGWLTLALSGSLFAHALFPRKGDKLKWIAPALLAMGGIFLFFFADLDLYRLLDPRQLRDREVQLHKTLAIILTVIGGIGLRRFYRARHSAAAGITSPFSGGANGAAAIAPAGGLSTPSKIVAVMALIGGGMLFTHVHTVAPYANVAAGVYIAHVVMGLTALGIGATRLLQDGLPKYRRVLSVAFATLMCLESVLLVTYNEGLPWYIGYGRYNRDGPHAGTVAPYGPIRAELTFDAKSNRLDLYVLDRFKNTPAPVPTSAVTVLISRGYTETGITLTAENGGPAASHFSAAAPFLKDAFSFSARAALPVNDELKFGFFDPWVTPQIRPVPPNEVAKFQCPMHDGVVSETRGDCPLCGMPMVPILFSPRTTLHDSQYDMRLVTTPQAGQIHPGEPVLLRFTPMRGSEVLRDLALVHERLLHLIVVSADLSFFDHVHPVMQPDGSLILSYTFPRAGPFLLFADITPRGERSQIFRLPVNVVPAQPTAELLTDMSSIVPSPALCKPLADDPTMTAQLIFLPRNPTAGLHTDFLFRLVQDGRPVNDLQPYIGAMGHCVVISQDTLTYLHCHPEQLFAPDQNARGGPDISFHTIFPKPGLYKIWGQFKHGDKVVVADFVVDIQPSILPPSVVNFLLDD
ncbi:MAG: hypothetical protein M3O30_07195 [Planctomycetota bacterium]|nr:hypothetical protein [Planctomycetota bacterium]